MQFIPLTSEQRQFFDDHGYLIVRNAIEPELLAHFTEAVDRLVDRCHQEDGMYRASLTNVIALEPILSTAPYVAHHSAVSGAAPQP